MKPRIFIASSSEGFTLAEELKNLLTAKFDCTLWKEGIFHLSMSTLESLYRAAIDFDFGVFVFSPDDLASIRGKNLAIARDNVIFELGLFMGSLGPRRGFFVVPSKKKNFHIPTDLTGITYASYDPTLFKSNPNASLASAVKDITNSIENNPDFFRFLDLHLFPSPIMNFKRTIILNFKNKTNSPVVVQLQGFVPSPQLIPFPYAHRNVLKNIYELKWPTFNGATNIVAYDTLAHLFEINSEKETFFPLDENKIGDSEVFKLINSKMVGELFLTCTWLSPSPMIKKFKINI